MRSLRNILLYKWHSLRISVLSRWYHEAAIAAMYLANRHIESMIKKETDAGEAEKLRTVSEGSRAIVRMTRTYQRQRQATRLFIEINPTDYETVVSDDFHVSCLTETAMQRLGKQIKEAEQARRESRAKVWTPLISAAASLIGALIGARLGHH